MGKLIERFLRLLAVKDRVALSRSTIYAKIAKGEFPRPVDLGGRIVAWKESEIEAWMQERGEHRAGYVRKLYNPVEPWDVRKARELSQELSEGERLEADREG
jgi:prophage regulatory protein